MPSIITHLQEVTHLTYPCCVTTIPPVTNSDSIHLEISNIISVTFSHNQILTNSYSTILYHTGMGLVGVFKYKKYTYISTRSLALGCHEFMTHPTLIKGVCMF